MNDNKGQRFGATLYVPAIHDTLDAVRAGSVAGLGTMVICLEDAIRDDQIPMALTALRAHLARMENCPGGPTVYIRPRNPDMAEKILMMSGVDRIRGFVIPKATADTLGDWVSLLKGGRHGVMPTLETSHAFDQREIHRMRDQTMTMGIDVDMVRIGGNDILSTIGARRSSRRTLYDGPLGPVVTGIVGAFAGTGIMLSSPVLEHYADERLLHEEIERDVEHGIFNKTAIHPRQVPVINDGLRPTTSDVNEAQAILSAGAKAVFGMDGSMCEPKTHAAWANMVLARQRQLGAKSDGDLAIAV
jgi:citrate lyase beta subunit